MLPIRSVSNRIFFISIVLLSSSITSFAQEDTTKFKRVALFEDISVLNADLSRTNNEISAQGYPKIPNQLVGVSIGTYSHPIGKDSYLSSKFGFYFSEPPPDKTQTKSAALRRFESQMQWNYDLVKSRDWLVYPYLGLGYGYTRLYLQDGINQPFNASLTNPPIERRRYSKMDIFGSAGLGVERRLRFDFGMDLYLGLVGGYRFSQNVDLQTSSFPAYFRGVDTSLRIRAERWKSITPRKQRERFKRFQ